MGTEDNISDDPEEWLPDLIRESWQPAIDALIEDGRDVAYKKPPLVTGGSDQKSGSSPQGQIHIKVYQDTPESPTLGSWNAWAPDQGVR